MMYLPMLSDEELLTYVEQTMDPLTTSEIERELVKRLQAQIDIGNDKRLAVLDEAGIDDDQDIEATLKVLDEFDCDSASVLREKLERADKFYDIAQDAGDVIDRLALLAKATL